MEPLDFARERQVLDRGPARNHAELGDVEVGVAGVAACSVSDQCLTGVAGIELGAIGALGGGVSSTQQVVVGSAVIPDGRVAAEQAARPVWIPVVIERTAYTPGRRQLDPAGTGCAREIDAVGGRAEADALVGGSAVTEHRKARRGAAGGD